MTERWTIGIPRNADEARGRQSTRRMVETSGKCDWRTVKEEAVDI